MAQDQTVAIVAIAVSGGVALVAAIIAPITAHYRQKSALNAESSRLGRQLAHDRQMRDLDDTRGRLDEVVDMGEAALSAVCEARLTFDAGQQKACDDQLWQARQCLGQYGYKERRVRLRIGHEADLTAKLVEYREAVQALYELTHDNVTQGQAVPVDAWSVSMSRVAKAQIELIDTAEAVIGARFVEQA